MTAFHFHTEVHDPSLLVAAVMEATGHQDVRLLSGWHGCDRVTGEMIANEATGAINVEWYRRKGRFSLDVNLFGRDFGPRETTARLCRAIARSLGLSVLFGDCSAFGYSYFSAEPDGSIWAQLLVIGDDDDRMDLDTYDHDIPRYRYPRLTFAPNEPLPEKPPFLPHGWRDGESNCDTPIAGKLCTVFALPCPKYRIAPRQNP